MGVGRDGRVIDLRVPTLGEGAGGVEGGKGVGRVVLRGEDARAGKTAVVIKTTHFPAARALDEPLARLLFDRFGTRKFRVGN